MKKVILILLILTIPSLVSGQNSGVEYIQPGKNVKVEGIPPIPKDISKLYFQYHRYISVKLMGWDPERHELRVLGVTRMIYGMPAPQDNGKIVAAIKFDHGIPEDYFFDRQGRNIIYTADKNNAEVYQLYLFDTESKKARQLTDGKSRNVEPVWSRRGDRVVWGTTPPGATGMQLMTANLEDSESRRMIIPSNGNPVRAFDWSPDDKWIVYIEYVARKSKSILWLVEATTGKRIQLIPSRADYGFYDSPVFTNDGRDLYLLSNQNSEYIRLASLNIKTKKLRHLTRGIPWDIESFALAPDGKKIAFVANENGVSKLHVLNTSSGRVSIPTNIQAGIISELYWHNNSRYLAFSLAGPQTPGDVYALDTHSNQVTLWSKPNMSGAQAGSLISPELIKWKSFDGRQISGFLYRPPSKYSGRRPVLIEIHGGPENQARPEFNPEGCLLVNELGIVLISPNIRGSTGYGKTFAALDNGLRRKDALKDIGALFEWIKQQPELDPNRIMVKGDSYGGYMALLTATHYGERLRGAICERGPSNLVTFLETTDGWRRDLRRREYGDEGDPKIRRSLSQDAPRNNTEKIKAPLLIIHGERDSRVHVNEALMMIEAMRPRGVSVWSVIVKNEGHGEGGFDSILFQVGAKLLFLKHFLLS